MKTLWSALLVLSFWIGILLYWSSGLTTFTIFSKTLKEAGDVPRELPDLIVINQDGQIYNLQETANYKLINFVYLSCPDVCHKVNNRLENIYYEIENQHNFDKLNFLTMSFDLANDNLERLKLYRAYFDKEGEIDTWDFAIPYQMSQKNFDQFLKNLGIWKYTDPQTLITNHSIYLFLISPKNEIIRVFDPARNSNHSIVKEILHCIREQNS